MNLGKTIFAQLMDFLPRYQFQECVKRYRGQYKVKKFSCWEQFLSLAFAQLTYREGLRDIEASLGAAGKKLYHMGFRSRVRRNTLANANAVRDWRIYADFAQELIAQARQLYANEDFGVELEQTTFALDSTIIDLCLSVFPWAKFRKRKGAVKVHTLLDLHGSIPTVLWITPGKVHDVNIIDRLFIEAGSIYVLDRGYTDFARLHRIHRERGYFVIRAKHNLQFRRLYSAPVDKELGLRFDQTVVLKGFYSGKDYPEKLRRVGFRDIEKKRRLVFLTNNFTLPALTISDLYRSRWRVELFFKWIKQHLRIKAFFGTTRNAVKTQIWIAITVYVLVAIVKKKLKLELSLYTILQILSVTLFEKTPILQVLSDSEYMIQDTEARKQLCLFD